MAALRTAIGILWLIAFVAGRELGGEAPGVDLPPVPIPNTAQFVGLSEEVTEAPYVEPAPPTPTDLFGNEVEQAVADYRVDPRGDIYERHSPDTAVMRPGRPKT
jgi:hypothetical protein